MKEPIAPLSSSKPVQNTNAPTPQTAAQYNAQRGTFGRYVFIPKAQRGTRK